MRAVSHTNQLSNGNPYIHNSLGYRILYVHRNSTLYEQVSNYDQCISGLCRTQSNSFMGTPTYTIRLATEYFKCTEILLCMSKSPITISVSAGCVENKRTHSREPVHTQFAWLPNTLCAPKFYSV